MLSHEVTTHILQLGLYTVTAGADLVTLCEPVGPGLHLNFSLLRTVRTLCLLNAVRYYGVALFTEVICEIRYRLLLNATRHLSVCQSRSAV